jgi:hypothetical protein
MKLKSNVLWVCLWSMAVCLPVCGQMLIPQQKIVASDRAIGETGYRNAFFGTAVALSGDYMVVGAPEESEDAQGANTVRYAGAAYIFHRQRNGHWEQVAKLVLSDRLPYELFGSQVAISGSTILVSAPYHANGRPYGSYGRVICFDLGADGRWWRSDTIYPLDARGGKFGERLALDANTAVISSGNLVNDGATERPVYVYHRTGSGLAWNVQAQLTPTDDSHERYSTTFGYALSIWQKRIAVGAWSDDLPDNGRPTTRHRGAVYIFEFNEADGQWHRTAKVRAGKQISEPQDGFGYQKGFGFGVSIFQDRCLITFANPDLIDFLGESPSYKAYIFHRQKAGTWAFETELMSVPDFARSRRNYALSLALTDSFALLGIGSNDSDASGTFIQYETGAAHLFQRTDTTWHQVAKLIPSDALGWSRFGASVALSERDAVMGSPHESRGIEGLSWINYAGAAYVANLGSMSKSGSGRVGADPEAEEFSVQLSPNPTNQMLTIRLRTGADEAVTLTLLNSQGQTMGSKQVPAGPGYQQINWPVDQLPTGTYLLKAGTKTRQLTQRMLKIGN